jgi:hypothetical protein
MAIWYNLWPFWYSLLSFGIFFPIWNVWTKKNLATLQLIRDWSFFFFKKSVNKRARFFRDNGPSLVVMPSRVTWSQSYDLRIYLPTTTMAAL